MRVVLCLVLLLCVCYCFKPNGGRSNVLKKTEIPADYAADLERIAIYEEYMRQKTLLETHKQEKSSESTDEIVSIRIEDIYACVMEQKLQNDQLVQEEQISQEEMVATVVPPMIIETHAHILEPLLMPNYSPNDFCTEGDEVFVLMTEVPEIEPIRDALRTKFQVLKSFKH